MVNFNLLSDASGLGAETRRPPSAPSALESAATSRTPLLPVTSKTDVCSEDTSCFCYERTVGGIFQVSK